MRHLIVIVFFKKRTQTRFRLHRATIEYLTRMKNSSAIVIGAGIVGLATARALAIRGYRVTVLNEMSVPLALLFAILG